MSVLVEHITAGYERDMRQSREITSISDLPLSFESITDEWLTAALCSQIPAAKVVGHRLSEADNGSSNRRKIYLDYNQAGMDAKLPIALFCKASHDLANRIMLGLSGGARCEVNFYNYIRPLLDIEAPVAYFARQDDETFNSMIMLGDITGDVLEFCGPWTNMTRQRAESQIRLLGTLHGSCHGNGALRQHLTEFPTFTKFFNDTLQFGMREGSEAGFLAGETVIPARLYRRHDEIWPATLTAIDAVDDAPTTLTHGDVHLKNWYVASNGQMGLSDWQCATRGHWGRDFAYTIATALTVEDRRAWERELLAYYLENLAKSDGPVISFDMAWKAYRAQLILALTWWTITLCPAPGMPDMQPRDVTLEFIKRIATAMDDLDSLDP